MVLDRPVAVVKVVDAAHPGDTGPLETWLDANPLANVLCILGKTEGNGCVNDYTRGYATSAIKDALMRVQSRRIERRQMRCADHTPDSTTLRWKMQPSS